MASGHGAGYGYFLLPLMRDVLIPITVLFLLSIVFAPGAAECTYPSKYDAAQAMADGDIDEIECILRAFERAHFYNVLTQEDYAEMIDFALSCY